MTKFKINFPVWVAIVSVDTFAELSVRTLWDGQPMTLECVKSGANGAIGIYESEASKFPVGTFELHGGLWHFHTGMTVNLDG